MQIFQSNEGDIKYEKYIKYVVIITCFIFLWYFLWAMLTDISDNGRAVDNLRNQLSTIREEQSRTQRSLESVQSELDASRRTVDNLEESNRNAQRAVDRISEANSRIADALNRSTEINERGTELTRESEQRIGESREILKAIRQTKEEP